MLVTTNTRDRKPVFSNPAYAREVVETLYRVQKIHPFVLYGFVIMPDHCHLLLSVPPPETISKVMQSFKVGVTFNTGLGAIWQSRFHINLPVKFSNALQYIHMNPVIKGLCKDPKDYPWSTASGRWDVSIFVV